LGNESHWASVNEKGTLELKDLNCAPQYSKLESADDKIKFLGDQIVQIEKNISHLDEERKEYLNQKQCLLFEIKKLMQSQYKEKLAKLMKDRDDKLKDKSLREIFNLSEEIVFTMFFLLKYRRRLLMASFPSSSSSLSYIADTRRL